MIFKLFIEMFKPPVELKDSELFNGVAKPSTILVGLIRQRMLADIDKLEAKSDKKRIGSLRGGELTYHWEYKNLKVAAHEYWYSSRESSHWMVILKNKDKTITLDKREEGIIKNTINEITSLQLEKQEAEEECNRQIDSLDAIEAFMGTPKKVVEYNSMSNYVNIRG